MTVSPVLPTVTPMLCPVCTQPQIQKKFQKNNVWICECLSCDHWFADLTTDSSHVNLVYGDEYFEGGKDGYPDYFLEQKMLIKRGEAYGKLASKYMKPGKVLDIGAAAGFLLKGLENTGWKGTGIEPNAKMAEWGQKELGLNILNQPVEAFTSREKFDLVTMIQVLPHFYDLRKALTILAGVTQPGGYWLIETWNKDSLTARLSGKSWHEFSPPSVLHWFSPGSVTELGSKLGFSFVAKGRKLKFINTTHAKTLLSHSMESPVMKKIINTLVPGNITLPYPSEDLFWILLKKN